MTNPKEKEDLWQKFLDEDNEASESVSEDQKTSVSDGSEWSGKFDRREKPRDDSANDEEDGSTDGM